MQGRNWKLAILLATTVGVMASASSLAIAQSDTARQQPQGLRDPYLSHPIGNSGLQIRPETRIAALGDEAQ